MESFLSPANQYRICRRKTASHFWVLLFHLYNLFINKGAFCFFEVGIQRRIGPYMETGDLSWDPTQMEAVPCKVGHTYLLTLLKVLKCVLPCGFGQTWGQHRSHLFVYCLGTNSGESCSKHTGKLGAAAGVSSDETCSWCSLRVGEALAESCRRGFGLDGGWSLLPGLTSVHHPPSSEVKSFSCLLSKTESAGGGFEDCSV